MEYSAMELKPQDLLVLLKQAAHPETAWTYARLGEALGMSASQVHRSVQRSLASGLAVSSRRGDWRTVRSALLELTIHAVRYVFPATLGATRRGIPTSFGVQPLSSRISAPEGEAPVWPHPHGTARGPSLAPLCRNAPDAALGDARLHSLLALVDALRTGRARERGEAGRLLAEMMGTDGAA